MNFYKVGIYTIDLYQWRRLQYVSWTWVRGELLEEVILHRNWTALARRWMQTLVCAVLRRREGRLRGEKTVPRSWERQSWTLEERR